MYDRMADTIRGDFGRSLGERGRGAYLSQQCKRNEQREWQETNEYGQQGHLDGSKPEGRVFSNECTSANEKNDRFINNKIKDSLSEGEIVGEVHCTSYDPQQFVPSHIHNDGFQILKKQNINASAECSFHNQSFYNVKEVNRVISQRLHLEALAVVKGHKLQNFDEITDVENSGSSRHIKGFCFESWLIHKLRSLSWSECDFHGKRMLLQTLRQYEEVLRSQFTATFIIQNAMIMSKFQNKNYLCSLKSYNEEQDLQQAEQHPFSLTNWKKPQFPEDFSNLDIQQKIYEASFELMQRNNWQTMAESDKEYYDGTQLRPSHELFNRIPFTKPHAQQCFQHQKYYNQQQNQSQQQKQPLIQPYQPDLDSLQQHMPTTSKINYLQQSDHCSHQNPHNNSIFNNQKHNSINLQSYTQSQIPLPVMPYAQPIHQTLCTQPHPPLPPASINHKNHQSTSLTQCNQTSQNNPAPNPYVVPSNQYNTLQQQHTPDSHGNTFYQQTFVSQPFVQPCFQPQSQILQIQPLQKFSEQALIFPMESNEEFAQGMQQNNSLPSLSNSCLNNVE